MKKWCRKFSLILLSLVSLSSCQDNFLITPPTDLGLATLNSQSNEEKPQYSYDGRFLVFSSDRGNKRSVFLYDRQKAGLVPLPGLNQGGSSQDQPDISANGRLLVYVSEQEGKPDIFVYDRETLTAKNITKNLLFPVRNPTISGNGRFISFESNRRGQWNIEIYDQGIETELPIGINSLEK
jgi:Tol biopolymer transport system component